MTPKVSVIIPVYNVEKYLRECLDSVVNQTFCDIEIICIDDGSTDSSGTILDQYASKDLRFVTIHQANAGQAAARNKALDIARGEYVLFVDSDDQINLDLIEKTYFGAVSSGSELVMFYMFSKDSEANISHSIPNGDDELLNKLELALFQCPGPCKWLWKKSLIDRIDLRFHEGIKFEDVPFVLKGALHSNYIKVVPEALYFYRLSNESTTRLVNRYYCDYSWLAYQLAYEDNKDLPLSDECLKALYLAKLNLIWVGYCNWTPPELLRQFKKNIKASVFPRELEWIENNQVKLSYPQRLLFLSIYGDFKTRLIAKLKIAKYKLADRIARFLIPHSPLIQSLIEKAKQGESNK